MQERTRFVFKHPEGYLNRMANGVTKNIFSAIWFHTYEEAESWSQGIYGQSGYEITQTKTVMMEVDNGKLL